jgi:hypothetical protein
MRMQNRSSVLDGLLLRLEFGLSTEAVGCGAASDIVGRPVSRPVRSKTRSVWVPSYP